MPKRSQEAHRAHHMFLGITQHVGPRLTPYYWATAVGPCHSEVAQSQLGLLPHPGGGRCGPWIPAVSRPCASTQGWGWGTQGAEEWGENHVASWEQVLELCGVTG